MGDWLQVLIDVEVTEEVAPARAAQVHRFLADGGVIVPELATDPRQSSEGYEPGPGFPSVLAEPLDEAGETAVRSLVMNVVNIVVGRQVAYAGAETTQVRCPVCAHLLEDEIWSDAVNAWAQGDDLAGASCRQCKVASPVQHIIFVPAWGFGHLSVTFWNWPQLHNDFVAELRAIVGRFAILQCWKI